VLISRTEKASGSYIAMFHAIHSRYKSSFLPFVRENQSTVMHYVSQQFCVCTFHIAWTKPKAFQEISNVLVSNVTSGEQRKGSQDLPHAAGAVSAIHSAT